MCSQMVCLMAGSGRQTSDSFLCVCVCICTRTIGTGPSLLLICTVPTSLNWFELNPGPAEPGNIWTTLTNLMSDLLMAL